MAAVAFVLQLVGTKSSGIVDRPVRIEGRIYESILEVMSSICVERFATAVLSSNMP